MVLEEFGKKKEKGILFLQLFVQLVVLTFWGVKETHHL